MKILLIDNYDSFTYNLYHYLSSLKCKVEVYRNDKIKIDKIKKNKYQKIVISPGPGNPDQAGSCLKIVKYFYKSNSNIRSMFRSSNYRTNFWIQNCCCKKSYAWKNQVKSNTLEKVFLEALKK